MEKGDKAAVELIEAVMRAYGWDRDQLADRVGKKKRTIDGIMRGELVMAQDLELHLQHLLESRTGSGLSVRETGPAYETMRHVMFIEERGTPEQIAAARAFLKALRDQVVHSPPVDTGEAATSKSHQSADKS